LNILRISCVVLAILLFAPLALAGTWMDDFDDGDVDDWDEVVGKWKLEDGAYAEKTGLQYSKTLLGDVSWTDYTVEVDVTLVEDLGASNCAGLLVRVNEEGNNGFRFWIRSDTHKCQIAKWMEGNSFTILDSKTDLDVEVGETYRLKVIAEGHRYQCFVDDELIFDYDDPEQFSANGVVGFIMSKSYPHFDNFVISGAQIPDNVAVEPALKLASCWGGIKSLSLP